ncbi:hypothetical protein ABXN37_23330 [Piscinibacter sakaiensis]|uniref:hypothetical protein n=1 Tax=Piscinibacter sakaiensis TaxID=1547922 RepID=UPI003728317D
MTLLGAGADGQVDARLVLPEPGVALGNITGLPGRSDFRITGQFRLTLARSELRQSLAIGSVADAAVGIGFPGAAVGPDRLTALHIEKTHRWDEARTTIDLRMRYDSPELGGAFQVATVAPLRSWLDTLPEPGPEQGEIRLLGRGGDEARVQVTGGGGGGDEIGGWLDLRGDGIRDALLRGTWLDAGVASGVFFADYSRWGRGDAYAYDPQSFALRPAIVGGDTLPTNATFTFQFTRPVAGAQRWRWWLAELGRPLSISDPVIERPVQVEVIGALVKVRPVQPLLYSRRYELRLDTGEALGGGQVIRATTGGALTVNDGSLGRFSTPNVLDPQSTLFLRQTVKAGAALEAEALAPIAPGSPPVRYRWTQVGGTPLTIARADERVTQIALAAGARGIGSSTVRLTVGMDGTDQTESADFVLRTVADTSDAWFGRLRIPADLDNASAQPREYWSGPAVGSLTAILQGDRISLAYREQADPAHPNGDWRIELRSADGRPLQPGRYASAFSSTWFQRPAGVPSLDITSGAMMLPSVQGEFVIHELQVDAGGNIGRLALDFVAPSSSFLPVTSSGSVRIRSGWALPP